MSSLPGQSHVRNTARNRRLRNNYTPTLLHVVLLVMRALEGVQAPLLRAIGQVRGINSRGNVGVSLTLGLTI